MSDRNNIKIRTIINRLYNLLTQRQYVPTEYYIFDDLELIYISIPKVACTSIKIALMANELRDAEDPREYMNVHSATAQYRHHRIARRQRDYYKFAFVRNPFDRLVSCYKDKVCKELQHNGRYHFATGYNNALIYRLFGKRFQPNMSFREFVELVAKIPDYLSDSHFRSQYSMLYQHGQLIPDHIGKFESLAEGWQQIAQRYQLPQLSERNRSTANDWRNYYTDLDIVEAVAGRYRQDIDAFDYIQEYMNLADRLATSPTQD